MRSSAVGEDSAEATFAGQQETYLWVGGDDVCRRCATAGRASTTREAIAYRARMGADGPPAMGVTVQLMVDAAVSGVMFTCNPVSGDPSTVAINASWGLGLAVVGGEVTPDEYRVSKVTGEVLRDASAPSTSSTAAADGAGPSGSRSPSAARAWRASTRRSCARCVDVARRVERHFGSHQDIEWAIAARRAASCSCSSRGR